MSKCSSRFRGEGGLNAFRLANRISYIKCVSHNLRSLEGCPDGLKRLVIGNAPHLSDLSPLASCTMMESLTIRTSSIVDISVVISMPLFEVFMCSKVGIGSPSIKDLSPLSSCPRLRILSLHGNRELTNISPLSPCNLEYLVITNCPLITSLAPLSIFQNLKKLWCNGIARATSLSPLASCPGLKELNCHADAEDLVGLRIRRPDLTITH